MLTPDEELDLARRIQISYRHATRSDHVRQPTGDVSPVWTGIAERNAALHALLVTGSLADVSDALAFPHKNDLLYGFENLAASILGDLASAPASAVPRDPTLDVLFRRLAEALGAVRLPNPEQPEAPHAHATSAPIDRRALIDAIEAELRVPLAFPNPYPYEIGIDTHRGLASFRAIHAIYQAARVLHLLRRQRLPPWFTPKVVEIGAGLGRTAFALRTLALVDYTIVDLPLANVAQASFLGRVLPTASMLALDGEPRCEPLVLHEPPTVRLRNAATWQPDPGALYHVVLNVDSLPEMENDVADAYLEHIQRHANAFLSINHESNDVRVRDLLARHRMRATRTPNWMRPGYVEEIWIR